MKATAHIVLEFVKAMLITVFTLGTIRGSDDWPVLKAPPTENKYEINDRREVCKHCLIEEYFFNGGGSWSPDFCPKCHGEDYVMFGRLNTTDKIKANKLFNKMWKEKHSSN